MKSLPKSILIIFMLMLILLPVICAAEGTVSGTVWIDKNNNGLHENDEKDLDDVRLSLESLGEDGTWNEIAQAESGKNGGFSFSRIPAGTLRLKATLPKNYIFASPGGDSAMLPASGSQSYSKPFVFDGKSADLDIGAITASGTVQVVVFEDRNANGGRLLSEPLLRDALIELEYAQDGEIYTIASATTNSKGECRISSLSPADYRLKVTLPEPYIPGPIGQKISAFYNCALASDNQVAYTDFFRLEAKETAGLGIGAVKTGALTGYVWFDANANGVMEETESGKEGVTMVLYSPAYQLTRTVVTDADGQYTFINLQDGEYTLRAELTDDLMYTFAGSAVTSLMDRAAAVTVSVISGETAKADTFGVMPDTCLSILVYEDRNCNGVRDGGEPALSGIPFEYDTETTRPLKALSNEDGLAVFHAIPAGGGILRCSLDNGYVFTSDKGSSLFAAKEAVTSQEAPVESAWGETMNYEVGLTRAAKAHGMIYEDPTMQGLYGDSSIPLEGFTVQIMDQSDMLYAETTTDENGAFLFDRLLGGEYKIRLIYRDPYIGCPYTGETDTEHPNQILTQSMSAGDTVYFTLFPEGEAVLDMALYQAGSVTGQILIDSRFTSQTESPNGLGGVKVSLLNENGEPVSETLADTTDDIGTFLIKGVIPGTYAIGYNLPENCVLTDKNATGPWQSEAFTLGSGENLGLETLNTVLTARISGRVYRNNPDGTEEPVSATITLTGAGSEIVLATDENGQYAGDGLMPGEYRVSAVIPEAFIIADTKDSFVSKALSNASHGTLNIGLNDNLEDMNIIASLPARLEGHVYYDANANGAREEDEKPIGKLSLMLVGDEINDIYNTDLEGSWQSEVLLPGTYTLTVALGENEIVMGRSLNEDNTCSISLTAGDGETVMADIGILRFGRIAGSLWDLGGNDAGLPQVSVSLFKDGEPVGSVKTNGAYSFDSLYPGLYTLSAEIPEGYLFARHSDTAERSSLILEGISTPISLSMGNELLAEDIGIGMKGGIGDFAWLDVNGNGFQDIGEPGLPLVKVEFLQDGKVIASAETDVYGYYRITDLYPGKYSVRVTAPEEVHPTVRAEGFPMVTSVLPEADDSVITVEDIYVPSGTENLNCDFGFALKEEGVYPDELSLTPAKDWTPYTQRKR